MANDTVTVPGADGAPNINVGVFKDEVGTAFEREVPTYVDGTGALVTVTPSTPLPVTNAASQTTLASILAKLTADPATQTTLAAILAKLTSDPATATGVAAIVTALQGTLATAPTTAGDVAASLTNGRKPIAAAGTAEALGGNVACRWVLVTALKTNTDQVNVGGTGVLATLGGSTGVPLAAGESVSIPVTNLNKVFADARVSGEGVSFVVGS